MKPDEHTVYSPHTSEDFERLQAERDALPGMITEAKEHHEAHNEAEVYQTDVNRRLQATEDMLEEFPAMNFMGGNMLLAPEELIHPGEGLSANLKEATGRSVPPHHDEYDTDEVSDSVAISSTALPSVQTEPQEVQELQVAPESADSKRLLVGTELGELVTSEEALPSHQFDRSKPGGQPDSEWEQSSKEEATTEPEATPELADPKAATSHHSPIEYPTMPFYARDGGSAKGLVFEPDAAPKPVVASEFNSLLAEKISQFLGEGEWSGPDFSSASEVIDRQRADNERFTLDLLSDPHQPALTKEVIGHAGMEPVFNVLVGDREFRLSQVYRSGGYDMAVGYTGLADGIIAPRLFYRSNSSGEWRAPNARVLGHFVKGKYPNNYANETKLNSQLANHLDALVGTGQVVQSGVLDTKSREWFNPSALAEASVYTYEQEVLAFSPNKALHDKLSVFSPGKDFRTEVGVTPAQYFEQLSTSLDSELEQAFTRVPDQVDYQYHAILGDVLRETYRIEMPTDWVDGVTPLGVDAPGALGKLDVEMNYDRDGRVWIGNICFASSPISSYGNNAWVFEGGLLLNKPIEYKSQIDGLEYEDDYTNVVGRSNYADITPLLDRLSIIKRFRQARRVRRRSSSRPSKELETQPLRTT